MAAEVIPLRPLGVTVELDSAVLAAAQVECVLRWADAAEACLRAQGLPLQRDGVVRVVPSAALQRLLDAGLAFRVETDLRFDEGAKSFAPGPDAEGG